MTPGVRLTVLNDRGVPRSAAGEISSLKGIRKVFPGVWVFSGILFLFHNISVSRESASLWRGVANDLSKLPRIFYWVNFDLSGFSLPAFFWLLFSLLSNPPLYSELLDLPTTEHPSWPFWKLPAEALLSGIYATFSPFLESLHPVIPKHTSLHPKTTAVLAEGLQRSMQASLWGDLGF